MVRVHFKTKQQSSAASTQAPPKVQRKQHHKQHRKQHRKQQRGQAREGAVQRLAETLLPAIQRSFSQFAFTRDDVLTLVSDMRLDSGEPWAAASYGLNDYTTGTRYRKVCEVVKFLVDQGELRSLDWVRVCLPAVFPVMATEQPTQLAYLDTVKRLVLQIPPDSLVDAMTVVRTWKSDQHLPLNIKRMTVRGILPYLEMDGLLRRGPNHEFVVARLT